eukprot:4798899-Amphidinium_carterae.1
MQLMPANAEPWTKMGEAMVMTNQLAESEASSTCFFTSLVLSVTDLGKQLKICSREGGFCL